MNFVDIFIETDEITRTGFEKSESLELWDSFPLFDAKTAEVVENVTATDLDA